MPGDKKNAGGKNQFGRCSHLMPAARPHTNCRYQRQLAGLQKGGWRRTTAAFIPFNPPLAIIYLKINVYIASFLSGRCCCLFGKFGFSLRVIILMSWSEIKPGLKSDWNKMWRSAILFYLCKQKCAFYLFVCLFVSPAPFCFAVRSDRWEQWCCRVSHYGSSACVCVCVYTYTVKSNLCTRLGMKNDKFAWDGFTICLTPAGKKQQKKKKKT